MAITETRNLPAQFIEDLGTDYAKQLTAATAASQALPVDKFAPQVAPQTALQQEATQRTQAGLGSYQPFLTGAGSATQAAGAAQQGQFAQQGLGLAQTGLGVAGQELTGAGTALGTAGTTTAGVSPFISAAGTGLGTAGTTLGGVSPFISAAGTGLGAAGALTGTGAGTGTGSVSSYMSPFQSQVIDTTLAEFDRQAAARQQAISDQAVALGGFGGGREGVLQSEYQTGSDRNRAALQAQLQAQGFSQAQAARQADLQNQMMLSQGQLGLGQATAGLAGQQAALAQGQLGLGQAQLGLGQAQAGQAGQQAGMAGQRAALAGAQQNLAQGSLGLGQFQTGLGQTQQALQGTDIARAGQVGAADQAFAQAGLDATRELERMRAYEPLERLGIYGQGVTGLMGGYPAQYQFTQQPNASPLAQALGVGATLGGLYGKIK
jgi:hypothetical protein